jgi:hypothetical protein
LVVVGWSVRTLNVDELPTMNTVCRRRPDSIHTSPAAITKAVTGK